MTKCNCKCHNKKKCGFVCHCTCHTASFEDYPATDYIVIGSGAAGCVVAARLAQAGFTVRVLEAGPDTSSTSTDPDVKFDIRNVTYPILGQSKTLQRFYQEHESCNCGFWESNGTLLDFVTAPQKEGAKYSYPRACGSGGCVQHHGTLSGVGPLEIYDNIANVVGDNYWLGSNIKLLNQKIENFQGPTVWPLPPSPENPDCPGGQAPGHGYDGWLTVKPVDLIDEFNEKIIEVAVNEFDITSRPDWGDGASGIGPLNWDTKTDGTRSNSFIDLLEPTIQSTGNVTMNYNCLVDKIVLEQDGSEFKAGHVIGYIKPYLQKVQSGGSTFSRWGDDCQVQRADKRLPCKKSRFYANKEIIICGGAIQSPTILMRSGIGPKEHLEDVCIDCIIDMPGVGTDIMDHTEVITSYEIDPAKYMSRLYATIWKMGEMGEIENPEIMKRIEEAYSFEGTANGGADIAIDWCSGVGSLNFADVHCVGGPGTYFNFDDPNAVVDLPYDPCEPHGGHPDANLIPDRQNPISRENGLYKKKDYLNAQYDPKQVKSYFSWTIESLVPGSTPGTVRLRTKDPRSEPIIDERLWEDDENIERMARLAFLIRDIMNHPDIKDVYGMPEYEAIPGPKVQTLEEMKEFIKNWYSYGHHISGGCQMSKPGEINGVVDSKLKVFGVNNLRVADTSIYPPIWFHGYNTARGAYIIGEACADLIISP